MRILTSDAMRAVDRAAIEELGIPGLVLMENAAIGVVDALSERFAEARRVVILCGAGNNGGDGLAVARQLAARGFAPEIGLLAGGRRLSADCETQREICRRMGLWMQELPDSAAARALLVGADLIVDALFGTGLDRPLAGLFAEAVDAVNASGVPVLAVDLPSGLDASRTRPIGPHVRATLTVTFAAPKIATIFAPASEAVGELVVTDLGISPALIENAPGGLHLLTAEELATFVIARSPEAHKGDFGHALLVAGSFGKSGAAALAARAAVRAGAGLVTVATPADALPLVAAAALESMTVALAAGPDGLDPACVAALTQAAIGKRALGIGPGLGTAEGTVSAVRAFVLASELPLVLDADGLNAFAGDAAALASRRGPTLLTPHPGELARLLGVTAAEIQDDRLGWARRAAVLTGAIVVLKGHLTLIADPAGDTFVNPTGNPGMASGGSGDVLTGVLAALLAQGYEPLAAAELGVYLHGLAGDLAAADIGAVGLRASDLVERLPRALAQVAAGE